MRRVRGFTLLELSVVAAVAGLLAVLAFSWSRAGRRNAGVGAATAALQMRIEQLQFQALSEQVDHVLVIADAPNNDASLCGSILSAGCARLFHLRSPGSGWKLKDFDVGAPAANLDPTTGAVVDEDRLGEGLRFHLAGAGAALPVPFNAYAATLKVFDLANLVGNCPGTPGSRKCVGYRFRPDGTVLAEPPDPSSAGSTANSGHAFALGSDLTGMAGGARQLGVLVTSPAGIVRTFELP